MPSGNGGFESDWLTMLIIAIVVLIVTALLIAPFIFCNSRTITQDNVSYCKQLCEKDNMKLHTINITNGIISCSCEVKEER